MEVIKRAVFLTTQGSVFFLNWVKIPIDGYLENSQIVMIRLLYLICYCIKKR